MYECPQCKSADTAKLSVIYATQTHKVDTNTSGGGIGLTGGGIGIGVGSANTTGTSQSLLAQSISPPSKPNRDHLVMKSLLLLGMVLVVFNIIVFSSGGEAGSFSGSFIILIVGLIVRQKWINARMKQLSIKYESEFDTWSKS